MKIGSLCSGYGGLDRGVQLALGGETVWVSDIDKGASKILAHRYPDVPNLGDFTTTDWAAVEPIDVLTAGFPCQPVSHAGKRLGDNDERWLWDDVARAVGELRPGLVVLENVRGLLTAGSGRLFGRVLGALADLGYDAQWHGLRAADVGAPHGRWRVFIVAHPTGDAGRVAHGDGAALGHAHLAGLEGHRLDGERAGERAAGAAGHQPADLIPLLPTPEAKLGSSGPDYARMNRAGTGGDSLHEVVGRLLPTPAVNDMGAAYTPEEWDAWTERMKAEHGNGNGHGKSLAIEAQRLLPTPRSRDKGTDSDVSSDDHAPTLYQAVTGKAGLVTDRPGKREIPTWGDYAAAIARWEHVLGRPAPPPTQPSKKGTPQLSPAFVEWLMGLPAGWVTDIPGITRNEALKALGNGVVPQQAAAALRMMLRTAADGAVA